MRETEKVQVVDIGLFESSIDPDKLVMRTNRLGSVLYPGSKKGEFREPVYLHATYMTEPAKSLAHKHGFDWRPKRGIVQLLVGDMKFLKGHSVEAEDALESVILCRLESSNLSLCPSTGASKGSEGRLDHASHYAQTGKDFNAAGFPSAPVASCGPGLGEILSPTAGLHATMESIFPLGAGVGQQTSYMTNELMGLGRITLFIRGGAGFEEKCFSFCTVEFFSPVGKSLFQ